MATPPPVARRPLIHFPALLHAAAYFALIAVHLLMASRMGYPSVFYDECTYLGFGRYFAGVAPMLNLASHLPGHLSAGHFGYGLILTPVFWLSATPLTQYHLALAVNAVLISSSYFGLYFLVSRLTGLSRLPAAAVSFVTCLYPTFLLLANYVATENAFIPVYLLAAAALLLFLERPNAPRAILLGLAAGAAYMIHARGLSVLLGANFFVLLAALRRRIPWSLAALPPLLSCGFYLATQRELAHLAVIAYGGLGAPGVSSSLKAFREVGEWKTLLLVQTGQLLYLLQCTLCLYLVGWKALASQLRAHSPERRYTAGFIALTTLAVAFGSALFAVPLEPYSRSDHLMLGRYNDGLLAILLALALSLVWRAASDREAANTVWRSMSAAAALSLLLTWIVSPAVHLGAVSINVLAQLPYTLALHTKNLFGLTLLVLAIAAALALSVRWSAALSLVFVAFVFSAGAGYVYAIALPHTPHPSQLLPLLLRTPAQKIDYDMAAWQPFFYGSYQLFLPHTRFEQFNSSRSERPRAEVVIASAKWQDAGRLGYSYVGQESGYDQALWIATRSSSLERLRPRSLLGVEIGPTAVAGVRGEGLHGAESDGAIHFRWTNGQARISVPILDNEQPRRVSLALYAFEKTSVAVAIDGAPAASFDLCPGGVERVLAVAPKPGRRSLEIEIRSGTFIPGPQDPRTLGVELRSLKVWP